MAGARGIARPRARAADDLSAEGSGLRARQTKGSPHAPEKPAPPPAVGLRVYIDGLTQGLEVLATHKSPHTTGELCKGQEVIADAAKSTIHSSPG